MAFDESLWEKCAEFHGHKCGGLAIGFQAACYAKELLELGFSADEEIVCITENDACGVDAIQVILGCSAGKGNLLFHIRGKQAFSFYNRKNGKSVRLVLNDKPEDLPQGGSMDYYLQSEPKDLFTIKEAMPMPEEAKIFRSYKCAKCGETTAENWLRLVDGEFVCLYCITPYDRFNV